jgi:predicted hydrocarbon binding protein
MEKPETRPEHWIERAVKKPVEVGPLESAAKGAQNCVFRITLPD